MNPKNVKSFLSLTPSYLLKVTEFLAKISQFVLFVVTEEKIFVDKFLFINPSKNSDPAQPCRSTPFSYFLKI